MTNWNELMEYCTDLAIERDELILKNKQLRKCVIELKHAIETHRYWTEYPQELPLPDPNRRDRELWNRGDAVKIENKTKHSP